MSDWMVVPIHSLTEMNRTTTESEDMMDALAVGTENFEFSEMRESLVSEIDQEAAGIAAVEIEIQDPVVAAPDSLGLMPTIQEVVINGDQCDVLGEDDEDKIHYMRSFKADEGAQTCCPEEMMRNYRIPLSYLCSTENADLEMLPYGPKDEFIISAQYIESEEGQRVRKLLTNLEDFRGSAKKIPGVGGRLVISRTLVDESRQHLSCISERSRVLAKNKKHSPSKKQEELVKVKNIKREAPVEGTQTLVTIKSEVDLGEILVAEITERRYQISISSAKRLCPKVYLNDELMDYGLYECMQRVRKEPDWVYCGTFAWSGFFFTSYKTGAMPNHKMRAMIKTISRDGVVGSNWLTKRFLVLPVQREKHWFLAIVCNPFPSASAVQLLDKLIAEKGAEPAYQQFVDQWLGSKSDPPMILLFDSMTETMAMKCDNYVNFHLDTANHIRKGLLILAEVLMNGLKRNHAILRQLLEDAVSKGRFPHYTLKVPQQKNQEDCGVFCMAYLHYWFIELHRGESYYDFARKDFSNWFSTDVSHLRHSLFSCIKAHCQFNFGENLHHLLELEREIFPQYCSG